MGIRWQEHSEASCIATAEKAARISCTGEYNGEVEAPLGYMYRFEDKRYSQAVDPYESEDCVIVTHIELTAFIVKNLTPTGVRIFLQHGQGTRFVSSKAYRRFACRTVDEAKLSYIKRKQRQEAIYRAKMEIARQLHMRIKASMIVVK